MVEREPKLVQPRKHQIGIGFILLSTYNQANLFTKSLQSWDALFHWRVKSGEVGPRAKESSFNSQKSGRCIFRNMYHPLAICICVYTFRYMLPVAQQCTQLQWLLLSWAPCRHRDIVFDVSLNCSAKLCGRGKQAIPYYKSMHADILILLKPSYSSWCATSCRMVSVQIHMRAWMRAERRDFDHKNMRIILPRYLKSLEFIVWVSDYWFQSDFL